MKTKTIIEWEVGDTVEVANDNEAPRLQAGAKCVVIGDRSTNSPRVRQTSPEPYDDGIWWIDATDLRPWTPGYGYLPTGERVPEPPEGYKSCQSRHDDYGEDALVYDVANGWIEMDATPNVDDCQFIRAYARRKVPALQLREGGYYRRRDDKIVGPMVRNSSHLYKWQYNYETYTDGGRIACNGISPGDLIAEVPAPEPQMVPFDGPDDLPEWPVIWMINSKNGSITIMTKFHGGFINKCLSYETLFKDFKISPDRRNWQTAGKEVAK